MKLITFAVPCFNSMAYMGKCIDSLLLAGDNIEIIIIDDGSTDDTGIIADRYQAAHPGTVCVIHKPNAGHGSAVNAGLENAAGIYFKVVDSDDYLDSEALAVFMKYVRQSIETGLPADLIITNFIYDHAADNTEYVSSYRKYFPVGVTFSWEQSKPMYLWHMLLMHALTFRTEVLKESHVQLPEHTFYVDNLFAFMPLPFVKNLFYLDIDLYRYYIGRNDQSVTITNMSDRYEQQIRVMMCMLMSYSHEQLESLSGPLRRHMYHFLYSVMTNTYFFTTQKSSTERKKNLMLMWDDLRKRDPALYRKMRHTPSVMLLKPFPWRIKGYITLIGYLILVKFVKLG